MKLFAHQEKVLQQTEDKNRVAYFLDMGLGKTYVGSEKAKQLGSNTVLLICQKSKINDWIQHYEDNYPEYIVFDLTKPKIFDSFFMNLYRGKAVGIINYELSWRRPALLNLKDYTLMLDESSLIQNKSAKQSKFILKLTPSSVILLSGTPTAGKYENLWTQAHLLGWGISHKLYQTQFVNWTNLNIGWGKTARTIKVVDKRNPYKNVDRLKNKLRENGAVFLKTEECFDLPEQTFIINDVVTSKEYKKFLKDSIIKIDDTELIGDTSLTKHLYLRQLCSVYSKEKLSAFDDLVKSTEDRLIVFYNFNKELEQLIKVAEANNRPVSQVNGSVKDMNAYENESNSIAFIQYQAGAMGLNLQKANKIIYYSLCERSELFEQSKKRIHRIGQSLPCYYYVMVCNNSIENAIYHTLKERKDWTDELFREYLNNAI